MNPIHILMTGIIGCAAILLVGELWLLHHLLLMPHKETPSYRAGILRAYSQVPYTTDSRRTTEALKQLQALSGTSTESDPTLDDIASLIATMQHEFGALASLETIIQTLVARDFEQQLAARRLTKLKACLPATTERHVACPDRAMQKSASVAVA